MIPKTKKEDFLFWRSPLICGTLGGFLLGVFVLGQVVTIKPYPNIQRDHIIFSFITGVGGVLFVSMGVRAWRSRRR